MCQNPGNGENKQDVASADQVRVGLYTMVPRSLREAFKSACQGQGQTQQGVLRTLVEHYTAGTLRLSIDKVA